MYDYLFQALKEDDGVVGGFYKHAKSQMEHYLETGIDSNMEDGWSGHTYMWQVQPDFHRNRQHIVDFVNKTFSTEYTELDQALFTRLQQFQHDYVTDESTEYPYSSQHPYNFWEFINGLDEFRERDTIYNITIGEDVKGKDYYDRFYFRRRQGWGKSVFQFKND